MMGIGIKMQLTEFQLVIAKKLLEWCLSNSDGVTYLVEGQSETFISVSIPPMRVCIYSDAFDVQSPKFDIRFEPDDITSLEHAQESLVESLYQASQRK